MITNGTWRAIRVMFAAVAMWQTSDLDAQSPVSEVSSEVRREWLAKLRAEFASASLDDSGRMSVLRQTRLDDLTFDKSGRIEVTGLCINQQAYLDTLPENSERARNPRGQIAKAVSDHLKTYAAPAGIAPGALGRINASGIAIKEDPARRLQRQAAETAGLDDIVFQTARFDPTGALVFDGLVSSEAQRAAAAGLIGQPAFTTVYAPPGGMSQADQAKAVATMDVVPWRVKLLEEMQARFARASNKDTDREIVRYCRLDQARFMYPDRGGLQLVFEGLCLKEKEADSQGAIIGALRDESRRVFPKTHPLEYSIPYNLRTFPNPRRLVHETVAMTPAVDGVRIDDILIGSKGETMLEGIWIGESQARALDSAVLPVLADALRGKSAGRLGHRFTNVPTDMILRDLRTKTAARLDETSLDRFLFRFLDDSSPAAPVLEGQGPDSRIKEVSAKLSEWLAADDRVKLIGAPDVAVAISGRPEGLLRELRTLISRNPALDGIRIDRVVFDESNTMTLLGLQDHEGQASQALSVVAAAVAKVWPKQPPLAPAHVGAFTVVPLGAKLERLKREFPSYRAADGVMLTRAHYGPDGTLTFSGLGAGISADSPSLETLVKKLAGIDSAQKVKFDLRIQPRDPVKAAWLVARGIDALSRNAIGAAPVAELDEAIFLAPEDSTAWYVRAAYCHAAGDREAAIRYLTRVKSLETDAAARARGIKLARFQGSDRDTLELLERSLPAAR